jgi:hypothetical protein
LLVSLIFALIGLSGTIEWVLNYQHHAIPIPRGSHFRSLFYLCFAIAGLAGTYSISRTILYRREIAYGLTDRRLIIVTGKHEAKSFGAKAFRRIKRTGKQRNTLKFNYDGEHFSHALYGISDAEHVERLLRQQFPPPEESSFWSLFGRNRASSSGE